MSQNLQEKLTSLKLKEGLPKILTQRDAVNQNKEYIRKRQSGELVQMKTSYSLLNKAMGGGFEPNTMLTLSAMSGGGKSTLSKRVINSILQDLVNNGKEGVGLSFNFEMLAHKTIGREVANLSKMTLSELYSSERPLASTVMSSVFRNYHDNLFDMPLLYVEEPQDASTIANTIYHYWKGLCKDSGSYMIVEIDHAVITKGSQSTDQKTKIDNLMEKLNAVKKKIASQGGYLFIIILSQMNREIKSKERIMNPELHYPMTNDLFAASSIEFFSDYIIISHMPAKLNLSSYTDNNFPVWIGDKETQFIYWHILKNRDYQPDFVVPVLNNLKYFDFEEIKREDFIKYCKEFQQTGICNRINESN